MGCMQALGDEPSIARRIVRRWGKHAAPEECDNLLTRFAWNLDQRGATSPQAVALELRQALWITRGAGKHCWAAIQLST